MQLMKFHVPISNMQLFSEYNLLFLQYEIFIFILFGARLIYKLWELYSKSAYHNNLEWTLHAVKQEWMLQAHLNESYGMLHIPSLIPVWPSLTSLALANVQRAIRNFCSDRLRTSTLASLHTALIAGHCDTLTRFLTLPVAKKILLLTIQKLFKSFKTAYWMRTIITWLKWAHQNT